MPPKNPSRRPKAPPNTPSKRSIAAKKAAKARKEKANADLEAWADKMLGEDATDKAEEETSAAVAKPARESKIPKEKSAVARQRSGSSQSKKGIRKKVKFTLREEGEEEEREGNTKLDDSSNGGDEADDESTTSNQGCAFLEDINEALEDAMSEDAEREGVDDGLGAHIFDMFGSDTESEVEDEEEYDPCQNEEDDEDYWPDNAQDAQLRKILKLVMYGGHSTFNPLNWIDDETRRLIDEDTRIVFPGGIILRKPGKEEEQSEEETLAEEGLEENGKGEEAIKTSEQETLEEKKGNMEENAPGKTQVIIRTTNKRRASSATVEEEVQAAAGHGNKRGRFKPAEGANL